MLGLAVADDVDADLRLPGDHVLDAALHRRVERACVVRLAAILREQEIDHFLRPRQAAHVRRQNPICAHFHPDLRLAGPLRGSRPTDAPSAGFRAADPR